MATYAVGDIQGCLSDLKELLKLVDFDKKKDCLWLAGDLVNRGPESLETLRFVKALGKSARTVLGNHDLHLLAAARGYKRLGRKDTLNEILEAEDRNVLLDWLIQQPLLHHDNELNTTMVHAGIPPMWKLKQAKHYAAEIHDVLTTPKLAEQYFANMYGNKPDVWDEDLKGPERWRVITNYFTRMRFCTNTGELEFDSKCSPSQPPTGYKPWFEIKDHACANKKILFGHWAALMGETGHNNFIGLDTGCVWGGYLTMLCLETGERYAVACELDS